MTPFRKRLLALGHPDYKSYLKSAHWKEFKASYRASGRSALCVVCGSGVRLHFHHHTYERLGSESFDDMTLLCGDHHDQVHACLLARRMRVKRTGEAVEALRSGERFSTDELLRRRAGGKSSATWDGGNHYGRVGRYQKSLTATDLKEWDKTFSKLGELKGKSEENPFWLDWGQWKTFPLDELRKVLRRALEIPPGKKYLTGAARRLEKKRRKKERKVARELPSP